MREKTPLQILAAVRLLMPRNKNPNWSLAMDMVCVGSTYGHLICREAGIDPDTGFLPNTVRFHEPKGRAGKVILLRIMLTGP
jgi:hypothetical protein